jgi:hypothetical protein
MPSTGGRQRNNAVPNHESNDAEPTGTNTEQSRSVNTIGIRGFVSRNKAVVFIVCVFVVSYAFQFISF